MNKKYPLFLIILFVICRVFWYSRGITFDGFEGTGHQQLLPFELLRHNLWESIWYMHIQPPLFNLFFGLINLDMAIVQCTWFLLGIGIVLAIYYLLVNLDVPQGIAFVAGILWTLSPSPLLYENVFFYTYPVMAMLVFSALALQRGHYFLFSCLLGCACLTRSLFHLAWMAAALLIVRKE